MAHHYQLRTPAYATQRQRPRKRAFLFGGIALAVLCGGLLAAKLATSSHKPAPQPKTSAAAVQKTPPAESGQLKLYAMGDMLAHDSVVAQAKTADGYNFKPYFDKIRSRYADADAVFCNPETLSAGAAYGISGYPAFNAPTEFARDLRSPDGAGCNVINLATNHINDKGQAALAATVTEWEGLKPLAYAGANREAAEQMRVRYFTKNGVKTAFLAFADYSNNKAVTDYGWNTYHNTVLVDTLVTEARTQANAVIVSMHWGTEDTTTINDDQRAAAQHLADLGVDLIIGTGPHMLAPMSYVSGKNGHRTLVWYSLGNVLSSQLKLDELTGGIAGITIVKKGQGVELKNPTFTPTFMAYDWPAADKAAENLAARRNLTLYLLRDPAVNNRLEAMFGPGNTGGKRMEFVVRTLTPETGVDVR